MEHHSKVWQDKFKAILSALLKEQPTQHMIDDWLTGRPDSILVMWCAVNSIIKGKEGQDVVDAAVSMTDASLVVESKEQQRLF